jgi:alpha-tubulin suppressor-like RCC1 family protein
LRPLQNISAIATRQDHTCALTAGGGVKCWGDNSYGELGDGTNTERSTPVDVVGLASGATGIATGAYHTCALTAGGGVGTPSRQQFGGVKCWGYNSGGELGDGTWNDSSTPVNVVGLASGVAAIATGWYHTCALTTGGGVKCWGENSYGRLGDGTTTERTTPVDVVGLASGVAAIGAGYYHTCALTAGGGVKCWGDNRYGQLGDGTTTRSSTPVDVVGLASGVAAISVGGYHTCVLTTGGGVKCWGSNGSAQLGDGTSSQRTAPVDAVGLGSGVAGIVAGFSTTCALTTGGGVKCWGSNGYGQLGDGTTTQHNAAVDVLGLGSGVARIAAGYRHTCALTTSGRVKCWGHNGYGQLGDGTISQRTAPVDVVGLASGVTAIAAGGWHTCAVTAGGGVKCWGENSYCQLGDGTITQRTTPVNVVGLANGVAAVAVGWYHTCALTTGGGVKCWGYNAYGELGDGTTAGSSTPVDVVGLASGVTAIAAGTYHTCAVTTGGAVKCWGYNLVGQLGDGTTTSSSTAVDVVGLASGVAAIATGAWHTCALTTSGGVKCWGDNPYGQLGDGTNTGSSTPVDVVGLATGVTSIATGGYHTCAVAAGGGVKCWGYNSHGQLGDGTTTRRWTPVDAVGLASGAAAVDAGYRHTCALTAGGGVKCWGYNVFGQLADGTTTQRTAPVDVVGLATGVTSIATGGYHTCALSAGGGVRCWGWDGYGQLGLGTITYRPTPVDVITLGNRVYLPLVLKGPRTL